MGAERIGKLLSVCRGNGVASQARGLTGLRRRDPSGRVSKSFEGWSGRRDSNPRPSAPKADALPDCATPRLTEWMDVPALALWRIAGESRRSFSVRQVHFRLYPDSECLSFPRQCTGCHIISFVKSQTINSSGIMKITAMPRKSSSRNPQSRQLWRRGAAMEETSSL